MSKPLLIFPTPTIVTRSVGTGNPFFFHYPSKDQQIFRFEDKISQLEKILENKTAFLQKTIQGVAPEMVLVLEIVGNISDFYKAIAETPGMEFLSELESQSESDDYFFHKTESGEKKEGNITTRLFLSMTNSKALEELKKYWDQYKKSNVFQRGTAKFKTLFEQLRDIRPYSLQDRLRDTGFEEYLLELKKYDQDTGIKFEIELVHKNSKEANDIAFKEVESLLELYSGSVILNSRVIIDEIKYHSFIAEVSIEFFDDLTENSNILFLQSQQILFFRPVGQMILKHENIDSENTDVNYLEFELSSEEPVIALLDGLPLENHVLLKNRLIIDDPDDFSSNYLAQQRVHGTTMASLILNGDLNKHDEQKIKRPIYVRPILKPNYGSGEVLPNNKLPIDIIHQALKRMFDGDNDTPPVAKNIKIINFSIGDPFRPFQNNISSWARLIDWLSYKYNVLFIISSGNCTDEIHINIPHNNFELATELEIQEACLQKLIETNFNRKILTPAESLNSITVGSSHHDASSISNLNQRKNLLSSKFLLSPISRIGFGFGKSIKPDILMPGGRALYRKNPIQNNPNQTKLRIENFPSLNDAPGNKVALPGNQGKNDVTAYTKGTSNAAALATKLTGELYEILLSFNETEIKIPDKYFTVLLKTLLVHGASQGEAQEILKGLLKHSPEISNTTIRKHILPYLGYGLVDKEKVLYCTDQRVTLLGFGELCKRDGENAHIYSFPLPNSLSSKAIDKKLTITLAWISPLNFLSSKYRKSKLYFDNLKENPDLTLNRDEYHFKTSQKGTVQHDILVGGQADAYINDSILKIKINSMQDASGWKVNEKVKYGFAVTLEIKENTQIPIYEEIKQQIQQKIPLT